MRPDIHKVAGDESRADTHRLAHMETLAGTSTSVSESKKKPRPDLFEDFFALPDKEPPPHGDSKSFRA